jgi:hypothetical protein
MTLTTHEYIPSLQESARVDRRLALGEHVVAGQHPKECNFYTNPRLNVQKHANPVAQARHDVCAQKRYWGYELQSDTGPRPPPI